MIDLRSLCTELVNLNDHPDTNHTEWSDVIDRVRTALATDPQGEVLSVDQLRDAWNAQADAANSWDELGMDEIICWAQRQALARAAKLGQGLTDD